MLRVAKAVPLARDPSGSSTVGASKSRRGWPSPASLLLIVVFQSFVIVMLLFNFFTLCDPTQEATEILDLRRQGDNLPLDAGSSRLDTGDLEMVDLNKLGQDHDPTEDHLNVLKKKLQDALEKEKAEGDDESQTSAGGTENEQGDPKKPMEGEAFPVKNGVGASVGEPFATNTLGRLNAPPGTPVVLFAYNRPKELEKTLNSFLDDILPTGDAKFPLVVSQDGDNAQVKQVVERFVSKGVHHLQFDYSKTSQRRKAGFEHKKWAAYHKLSAHYKFALGKLFDECGYDKVIVIEDDFTFAPDFLQYFHRLAPLLDSDPSLYCISAWNDNGQDKFVKDSTALYRTEVFPGLGWMLSKKLWDEKPWPIAFWDEHFRAPDIRNDRSCVIPEVNRVYTFGAVGTSKGQHYKRYLKPIKLNQEAVDWDQIDIEKVTKDRYDRWLDDQLARATKRDQVKSLSPGNETFYVTYNNLKDFTRHAKSLGIMVDHKENMPRASYKGVVQFRLKGNLVFFVPADYKIKSLDPNTTPTLS